MPITALPIEILSLVLTQLCLVRNIKGVKRTCRAFRDAAPAAEQAHRRVCFEGSSAAMTTASLVRSCSTHSDAKREASRRRTRRSWRVGRCWPCCGSAHSSEHCAASPGSYAFTKFEIKKPARAAFLGHRRPHT